MKRTLKIQRLFRVLFLVMSAPFWAAPIASAATRNWEGDTSTNYSTGANWSSGNVPGSSDSARFNNDFTGSYQPQLTGDVTLGRILFASNLAKDVTLSASSGTMTLGGVSGIGIRNQSSGYSLLISAPLRLGDDQIWRGNTMTISGSVDTDGRTLSLDPDVGNTFTLSGAISGTGAVIQDGKGTVVYSGSSANTYTGTTTVNDGTLTLNKTAGVDAIGGGSINVNSGGTLLLASANQIHNAVNLTLDGGIFDTGTTQVFPTRWVP